MDLDLAHDGRLVADIVREWSQLHPRTVPTASPWRRPRHVQSGASGEHVEMDALDFVRTLSGRLPGTGAMAHPLPL